MKNGNSWSFIKKFTVLCPEVGASKLRRFNGTTS